MVRGYFLVKGGNVRTKVEFEPSTPGVNFMAWPVIQKRESSAAHISRFSVPLLEILPNKWLGVSPIIETEKLVNH